MPAESNDLQNEVVRIDEAENTLVVTNFVLNDRPVAEYFAAQSSEQREERLKAVIRTGVMALSSADVASRVDYVKGEFAELRHKMDESINSATQSMDDYFDSKGKMPAMIEEYLGDNGKITKIMGQYVGEDGNMRKVISDMVTKWTEGLNTSMDPNNPEGLLSSLKNDLNNGLNEIKEIISRGEGARSERIKSTAKGRDFEEECLDRLSDVAHYYGDAVEPVGTQAGSLGSSRKGDILIEIVKFEARIVIETKDIGNISKNEIEGQLSEAMENRDAHFGLFIVKNVEAVKKSMKWFYEFNSGDKLAVALGSEIDDDVLHEEILLIAYKWARAKAVENVQKQSKVDTVTLAAKMDAVRKEIDELRPIYTSLKSIDKSTKNIRDIVDAMVGSANKSLDEINSMLQKYED